MNSEHLLAHLDEGQDGGRIGGQAEGLGAYYPQERGVPSDSTPQPTKPTNTKWIPTIPTHWKTQRAGHNFQVVKEICGKRAEELPRLALTLNGVIRRPKNDSEGLQPANFLTYQILRKNELVFKLIDLENTQTSRVGRCPFDIGIVSPAYIILRAVSGRIMPKYAEYYFLSLWMNHIFNGLGSSGVRSNLNATDLTRISIPVPPLAKQEAIVSYLDEMTGRISDMENNLSTQRAELLAYRQSVISEYVTGKKRVS